MIKRWVYADPHFYHENVIKYANRPFTSAYHMNEELISRYNALVKKEDKVFILGDFALSDKEKAIKIADRLKGRKILIMGNHDKRRSLKWWSEIGFEQVIRYPIIIRKYCILSHEPVDLINSEYINVHGHLHAYNLISQRHFNASVEVTNYKPVELDDILRRYSLTV